MSFSTMRAEKKQWKNLQQRVKAMPSDYQFVFKEMQKYMFKTVVVDSQQSIELFTEIIELFEEGIINNKDVLSITSRDVAGFCDSITSEYDNYAQQIQDEVEASIKKALTKTMK